jgi:7,8-dihydro-6-hydroxymethylpterin-pyrophosphokinase
MSTVRAYVALGANIGAPVQHLRAAVVDLAALPGTRVVARSSLYRSAPVGLVDQPDFINAVVAIDTHWQHCRCCTPCSPSRPATAACAACPTPRAPSTSTC